jgi:hypothetical protein
MDVSTLLIKALAEVRGLAGHDMDLKLTGKVELVRGSKAGIGFAIAKSLAIKGAHVFVNGRTQTRFDAANAPSASIISESGYYFL